jgi:hypothetical protein
MRGTPPPIAETRETSALEQMHEPSAQPLKFPGFIFEAEYRN